MLKPVDIDNYVFKKAKLGGGYDVDSVEDFMETLSEDYETLYTSYEESKSKIDSLNKEIEELKNVASTTKVEEKEETVFEPKIDENTTADEIEALRKNALIEAEQIIEKATESSKESIKEMEEKIKEKNKEYDDLKKEVQMFKIKFEAMLQTQLKILKTQEK